ncbi:hypothetical protein GJ496_010925 [Pomphorhynchus laevis]|nr:hypothetical protein GJ496_010925 [Pomphorhynchus laevis]
MQNRPTEIDESSPAVLKYRTPYFRASSTFQFPPINDNSIWKVGWVQACTSMKFINTYGVFGTSEWRLPCLENNKYIMDGEACNYPFYGGLDECVKIWGPTKRHLVKQVTMTDSLSASISTKADVQLDNNNLTGVFREQSFTVWLAVQNAETEMIFSLKTINWKMKVHIRLDSHGHEGAKYKLDETNSDKTTETMYPVILDENQPIPELPSNRLTVNNSQILVWNMNCSPLQQNSAN